MCIRNLYFHAHEREISKEDVAKALAAEPDIKAVVIVSPNYYGVVSDVKGIAEVAHSYRIPLIVVKHMDRISDFIRISGARK